MVRRSASEISLNTIEPISINDSNNSYAVPLQDERPAHLETEAHLCSQCQSFNIQAFADKASQRCGYRLSDVEKAAARGCDFCALLSEAVIDVEKPEYFHKNAAWGETVIQPDLFVHMTVSDSYRKKKPSDTPDALNVNRILVEVGDRFSEVRSESKHELCLAADPSSPAALSGDISGRYMGSQTTSESHFEAAKTWINACTMHAKCNETISGSVCIDPYNSILPSRCVEVAREHGYQRLYLRNTEGLQGAYITLTHRWNKDTEICKTTTSNYEQRLLGGDFGPLPQLFKDSFAVAEKLGIKYLWIDSICIIQVGDGGSDWHKEAPKMSQYYQFSIFTLAGTADDMSGGILQPYPQDLMPWGSKLIRLPYRDRDGRQSGHFFVYKRRVPVVEEYMSKVRSSILFQRGWILQEWLLSKRILWYTPNGLFFECPEVLPWSYDQSQLTFHRANPELQSHLQLRASFHYSSKDILGSWYHALELYSSQHLTKPNLDRILALTGLAKEVGSILASYEKGRSAEPDLKKEVYLAGLWLRDIHHGLLWEEHHSAQKWTDIVAEAPSWSWASLMLLTKWPERGKGTHAELQITGVCLERKRKHNVPEYSVYNKHRLRPFSPPGQPTSFDPTNMFSCLHIKGKLHTVHARGYLDTEENLTNAALSTAYGTIPKSCNWRAICSAFRPEIISGWGSLERLHQEAGKCSDYGIAVTAIHISTRYLYHGLWFKTSQPIYDVLFIKEVEGQEGVYQRLGVGRIGDASLIREIASAPERHIQLV